MAGQVLLLLAIEYQVGDFALVAVALGCSANRCITQVWRPLPSSLAEPGDGILLAIPHAPFLPTAQF